MSCPICNHTELEEGVENCPKCGSDLEIFTHIESVHKEDTFQKKAILVLTALFGIVVVSWGSVSFFSGGKTENMEAPLVVAETTSVAVPSTEAPALTDAVKATDVFVTENDVKSADPLNTPAETPAVAAAPLKDAAPAAAVTKAPAVKETPKAVKVKASAPKVSAKSAKSKASTKSKTKAKAHASKVKVKAPVAEAPAENGVIIHTVKRGDSFWKISKKYFGNGSHAKQIAADNGLNPQKNIPLGTQIKINK